MVEQYGILDDDLRDTFEKKKSLIEGKKTLGVVQDPNEDPYNSLGFGVNAFLNLIKVFMIMYAILSILALPAIIIFLRHDGMKG